MSQSFWHISKQAFITAVTYRSEIVLWFVLDQIPVIMLMLIWGSLLQNGQTAAGYSLNTIVYYYYLTTVIGGLTGVHFETWRVEQIRDGKIDFYLTRPIAYLLEILFFDLGRRVFSILATAPGFILIYFVINALIGQPLINLNPLEISQVVFLLVAGFGLEFLVSLWIVLLGFWFEGAEGIQHFKWMTLSLLGGAMLPVQFMPSWLQTIVTKLPFRYMYSVPIGIMQHTMSLAWTDIAYLSVVIASLIGVVLVTWRMAQYQYSSAGG